MRGSKKQTLHSFWIMALAMGLVFMGCRNKTQKNQEPIKVSEQLHNSLTDLEKEQGWELPSMPDGQPMEGGDLMTVDTFDNYELYFEWKILKAGNTGLKYNVSEELSQKFGSQYSALGFEYQLLDDSDTLYAGKLKPSQYTGSLYDMIAANNADVRPAGMFNSSRIVVNDKSVEHWLNGKKVVAYEFASPHLDSLFQKSKFVDYPGFLEKRKGHIVLQNHKDDAWFRNIKIRKIESGS